jgi:branched-chain amino acid transport system ATP-binding protein
MSALAFEVANLAAGYGETRIIEAISFAVPAGGRLAILGRNGVGKTTLLATLVGQTRRHHGEIRLGPTQLAALSSAERARAGLGYVPQTRDVFRSLTVEENLFVGLKDRPRAALAEAYTMFPRLGERRRQLAGNLSGGEQQMLSTARAILGAPSVLLLDEPLEGLAPVICDEVMRALTHLAGEERMTILLVEQQIARALDFAETVLIVERGRAVWSGTSAALRADGGVIERYLGVAKAH